MRTREEQIIECAQHLISMRTDCEYTEYDLVERIIHEAEQRVRAEIGRDSERLDWLEGIVETGFRVSPIGIGISGASFNHGYGGISAATLRSAIDAARGVG